MTEDHRPAFPTADNVTEVPLVGEGVEATPTSVSSVGDRPPTGRGRWIAIAAAAAVMIAATVFGAAALLDGGNDGDTATPTSLDPGPSVTAITTPPTLSPLDTLPPPDDPATTEAPQPTSSQDRSLFDGVQVPTYPEAPDATLREIVEYDIATAVERLGDDAARQSETHYELGTAGFVLDVRIVRDPIRDRYQIVTESRNRQQVAIVDVASGTTYVNPGTDNRIEISNAEIIADSPATTVNEYFDRLLKGPVRPDSFVATATRGRSLVVIPGIGAARDFVTSVDGELIPEWQVYAFGPVFEFQVEDRPARLDYHVYVDDDDDIIQVDGVSMLGDVPQLVQHRLTLLDEPPEVDLPADEPAVATSSSVSSTTSPTTTDAASG